MIRNPAPGSTPDLATPRPTAEEWTILRRAFAIGYVSYDGDTWYAAHAGYGYDEAEATMEAARAILARIFAGSALDPTPSEGASE